MSSPLLPSSSSSSSWSSSSYSPSITVVKSLFDSDKSNNENDNHKLNSTIDFFLVDGKEKGHTICIGKNHIKVDTTLGEIMKLILQQILPPETMYADNIVGSLQMHLGDFGKKTFYWQGEYHRKIEDICHQHTSIFNDFPFPENYRIPIQLKIKEEKRSICLYNRTKDLHGKRSCYYDFHIENMNSITLREMKQLIEKETKISLDKRYLFMKNRNSASAPENLFSEEVKLDDDDKLLSAYDIKHRTTITIEDETINFVSSSLGFENGLEKRIFPRTFQSQVDLSTTRLQDLKRIVSERESLTPDFLTFSVDGTLLQDDSLLLSDYNIGHRSTIEVGLTLPPFPAQISIKISDDNGDKDTNKNKNYDTNSDKKSSKNNLAQDLKQNQDQDQEDNNNANISLTEMVTIDIDSSSTTIGNIIEILQQNHNIESKKNSCCGQLRCGKKILHNDSTLADSFLSHGSQLLFSYAPETVYVQLLSGKCIPISYPSKIHSSFTVLNLKEHIQKRDGAPLGVQRLVFEGNTLEDENLLSSYKISIGSTIHLILCLRGGGSMFADVSNENAIRRSNWSSIAPNWRTVSPGLSIEGRCENHSCPAYCHMVICNQHFEPFDLCNNSKAIVKVHQYQASCPQCRKEIVPIKPGFSNCYYRIEGMKVNEESGEESLEYVKDWTKAGNHYITYNEVESGMTEWKFLYIHTRPLQDYGFAVPDVALQENLNKLEEVEDKEGSIKEVVVSYDCPICFEPMRKKQITKCSNGHFFHQECLTTWKGFSQTQHTDNHTHQEGGCPICRVNLSR